MLVLGHHVGHELTCLLIDVVGVEQNIADVTVEIVANGANHEAGFLVNQESALAALASAFNGGPELDQVVQVPLQFRGAAANACSARNDAGASRVFQLIHSFFKLGAVFTLNASANTAAAWIVGHQDHVAACQ